MISVHFTLFTGLKTAFFHNARLSGDWNNWSEVRMTELIADDGCPAFAVTVSFADTQAGATFKWGVRFDGPSAPNMWAINLEIQDQNSQERYRTVVLPGAGMTIDAAYYFTYGRKLGAHKNFSGTTGPARLRFSAWAPNAQSVDVVFGLPSGYIADDGTGIDGTVPAISLSKESSGVWSALAPKTFSDYVGVPYMLRLVTAQGGSPVFRTDIHSRWQMGRGGTNPHGAHWTGDPDDLDGTVSCGIVIDQDVVRKEFEPTTIPPEQISDVEFWSTEFTTGKPVPTTLQDLVIYELCVGSLGYPGTGPGTLADAIKLLDYLSDLGVNAVELLPMSESSGALSWGYGDTHHLVIESSAGSRDKYKHFVRECHRRGIAVIQDVCYNHFDSQAERAEWQYDSTAPEQNIYYWYEGTPSDYSSPAGGYVDNGSSGWSPRFWEEPVRQLFITSAAQFVTEFHVDGLRVDLTQALHRDNALHANGRGLGNVNQFGQKFLREWSRTLKMLRPSVMLIAEDHTGWDAVTRTTNVGGLGFDATWFAEFYHHLIGDSDMAGGNARLLHFAGLGEDGPLSIDQFSGRLWASQFTHVVYHESHDEAGNAGGTRRTSEVAVNNTPIVGVTRAFAEARCRVVAALSILSAGTPMFFMGEEILAQKICKFDNIGKSKEDLHGEKAGNGARMFRFYQDLIRLRRANPAVRSNQIDIVHAWDATRVIAFTRQRGSNSLLVIASLNNHAFADGYVLQSDETRLPSGGWQETFNSDAGIYGGSNTGNFGAVIPVSGGQIQLRLPSNGVLVLQRR